MPAWFLNAALTRFRNEVNSRWPRRDKTSDGTIGDAAHQATSSDHNPDPDGSVDAWDMDVDGVDVQKVIAVALKHESIQYVIYNRRITSRSWGLGTWRTYTGASPHTEHVHFNTRTSHEGSAKPWFPAVIPPPVPPKKETQMYRLKAKDGPAVYLDNGAHVPSAPVDDVLEAAGVPLVLVNTTAELMALMPTWPRPAGASSSDIADALRAALGEDLAAAVGADLVAG